MKKRVEYSGSLRTSINRPKNPTNRATCDDAYSAVQRAREEKLSDLCRHYKIQFDGSRECFRLLALSLAVDHVPGFQVPKRKLPAEEKPDLEIAKAIWELRLNNRKLTLAEACQHLARHDPLFRGKKSPKALESAFKRINAVLSRMHRDYAKPSDPRRALAEALVLARFRRYAADGYPVVWAV